DSLNVTFHGKLGTQGARVERMRALASSIATLIGADPELASRAAVLAKADLQTEVVVEFPPLQGAMGRKYAVLQVEHASVAAACEEHYKPQGPSDFVPKDKVSVAVALADKLDTLTGFWLIDEKPTGSKDPYALRRAALGVIRLILENDLRVGLNTILATASGLYPAEIGGERSALSADLLAFIHDRFKVYLKDEGARYDAIDAVLTPNTDNLLLAARRLEALIVFIDSEDGQNLIAGTKRAANILAAEEKKGTAIASEIEPALFTEEEERALHAAITSSRADAEAAIAKEDFSGAMRALAALRGPVDTFFDKVLVNDESEKVRANRLAL